MLLIPILKIIDIILEVYSWIVIIAVIFSLLSSFNVINHHNRFVYMVGNAVNQLTEPVLRRIRRYLPNMGGIDFSPFLLLLAIYLIRMYLGMAQGWLAS
jgi:YggT family protein